MSSLINSKISSLKVDFVFPNLKTISESDCSISEFLALVAQRLLIKQYTCFAIDISTNINYLCKMKKSSEWLHLNGPDDIKNIKLYTPNKTHVKDIISKLTSNEIDKKAQRESGKTFVTWFESNWFNGLKSDSTYSFIKDLIEESLDESEMKDNISGNDDWGKLASIFGIAKNAHLLGAMEESNIDTTALSNESKNLDVSTLSESFDSLLKFMKSIGGNIPDDALSAHKKDISIVPSSMYYSTLACVEDIKNGKIVTNSPYEPYRMFKIFDGTIMDTFLKMHQLSFTTYTFFKKMSL